MGGEFAPHPIERSGLRSPQGSACTEGTGSQEHTLPCDIIKSGSAKHYIEQPLCALVPFPEKKKYEGVNSQWEHLKNLEEALVRSTLLECASKYRIRRLTQVLEIGESGCWKQPQIADVDQAGESGEGANHGNEE